MDKKKLQGFSHMLSDFLYEEEANISRKKIISVGAMLALATIMMTTDAFARHSSHGSHGSHGSHSSHVSGSGHYSSTQSNHASHSSGAHSSHASHSSSAHGNHASHASAAPKPPVHGNHASHSSAYIQHSSHSSSAGSYYPSHSNSGSSEFIPEPSIPQLGNDVPTLEQMPNDMIDIRIPLVPPDSPPSSKFGG